MEPREGEDETNGRVGESNASKDDRSVSEGHSKTRERWWSPGKLFVAFLLATAVLWAPPLSSTLVGGFDNVRDFFRSYDDRRVDDLHEYLRSSDIWTEKPHIFGSSLTYIARYGDYSLVSVEGLEPSVVTPQQVNEEAVTLSGEPIVLVGRVVQFRERTSSGNFDYSEDEIRVAGPNGGYVWCGLGGTTLPSSADRGEVVVLRGLVTAIGPVGVGVTRRDVAYFTVLERIDYFTTDDLPPNVRALVKRMLKAG
jgi:hypothetical protein